ncbi:hypothetical protein ABZP36_005070 [Zizania latifolia]
MVMAVLLAVLLMQCCNAIAAARLLEGDVGSWRQSGGAVVGELILQVLKAGDTNPCTNKPGGSGGSGNCHT